MLPWPGDHHHRQIRMLRLDEIEHLEAVEPASLQPDVQEDEVRTPRLDGGQGLVGRSGRARAVAFVLQDAGHEFANVDFVVDDENVSAHRLALRESFRLEAADASSAATCFVFGIHMRTCPPRPAGLSTSSMPPPWSSRILLTIGKPRPGAALAGRHVGLQKPLPALDRKALAVVGDGDDQIIRMRVVQQHRDLPLPPLRLRHGRDGLRGVLDDVRDGLRHEPAVERRDERILAAHGRRTRSRDGRSAS